MLQAPAVAKLHELDSYLSTNPLAWWYEHKHIYPCFHWMALDYLSIPGMSSSLLGDTPLRLTFPPIMLCHFCTSLLIVTSVRGCSASSDVSSDISPSPLYIPPYRR